MPVAKGKGRYPGGVEPDAPEVRVIHTEQGADQHLEHHPVRYQDNRPFMPGVDLFHDLHRPYADILRDGIHELRLRVGRVNYRMLYFFHGNTAVVLTHGLTKEKKVPNKEIDRALDLKKMFEADPESHTFLWEP